jgi:hypothetical protein
VAGPIEETAAVNGAAVDEASGDVTGAGYPQTSETSVDPTVHPDQRAGS